MRSTLLRFDELGKEYDTQSQVTITIRTSVARISSDFRLELEGLAWVYEHMSWLKLGMQRQPNLKAP